MEKQKTKRNAKLISLWVKKLRFGPGMDRPLNILKGYFEEDRYEHAKPQNCFLYRPDDAIRSTNGFCRSPVTFASGYPDQPLESAPAPHDSQFDDRFDRRRPFPLPSYRPYYQPGYRINPLPYGHNRIFVNNTEYFFSNGYFYRPSCTGYVIVEAPIGAIVFTLPRLHQFVYWHGHPYYIVGDTYFRRQPGGYIVVPNPGFRYR